MSFTEHGGVRAVGALELVDRTTERRLHVPHIVLCDFFAPSFVRSFVSFRYDLISVDRAIVEAFRQKNICRMVKNASPHKWVFVNYQRGTSPSSISLIKMQNSARLCSLHEI